MRLDSTAVDADREAAYQAARAAIAGRWTPEQAKALGERLARYRSNRMRAEGGAR